MLAFLGLFGEGGQHHDGDGRGVGAALFFGHGDALHAVDAGFGSEEVVSGGRTYFEDGAGEGGHGFRDRAVRGVGGEGVGEAEAGAEGLVHFEEAVGEEGGFGAAGAWVKF